MRVAITGATGNVGTSLVRAFSLDPDVDEVIGLARRIPDWGIEKTRWVSCDISRDAIAPHLEGCDALVHLAWQIQPSRDVPAMWATNVSGTDRVLQAVAQSSIRRVVYASSVGAYSKGPKRPVDESWPTDGIPASSYSWMKAYVERMLDRFEVEHPEISVARLRPALIFKGESATGIRRVFLGPLFPSALVSPRAIPVVPINDRLVFQALHADDVAEAYRLATHSDATGAFNVAADPVVDANVLASILSARTIGVSPAVIRAAFAIAWHLRLVPSDPGWADLAFQTPLLDVSRAKSDLGWEPKVTSIDTIKELLQGLRSSAQMSTPPLAKETSGAFRYKELLTGMGSKDPVAKGSRSHEPVAYGPRN